MRATLMGMWLTVQVANYANVGVKGSYQIVVDVERLP